MFFFVAKLVIILFVEVKLKHKLEKSSLFYFINPDLQIHFF